MAAALTEFSNWMGTVLLIDSARPTNGAGRSRLREAIVEQGINSFANLRRFHEDGLTPVFTNVRSPGGVIPDPANPGQFVRNRGQNITAENERNLQKAVHGARYYHIVQTTFDRNVTLDQLNDLWDARQEAKQFDNDFTPPGRITNFRQIKIMFDTLESYFAIKLGSDYILLQSVIRDRVELPGTAGTPSEHEDNPAVNMPDRNAELIRRARHNGPAYATNKRSVWRVLRAVFHNTEAFPFIERFEVTFNGRQAWFTLKGHYLGRSFTATICWNNPRAVDVRYTISLALVALDTF